MIEIPIQITGVFSIPRKHRPAKVLNIRQEWVSQTIRGRSVQFSFRHKQSGDKPYVPKDIIEICHEKYKAIVTDWATAFDVVLGGVR